MNDMIQLVAFVGGIASIVGLLVYIYEGLPTPVRQKHKEVLSLKLSLLKDMRPLALAQEDARRLLKWLNTVYSNKSGTRKRTQSSDFQFLSRSVWLGRPLKVSLLIASCYVIPLLFLSAVNIVNLQGGTFSEIIGLTIRYSLFYVPTNAALDLCSINVSRKLLAVMTKSGTLLNLIFLASLDLILAILLYFIGGLATAFEYRYMLDIQGLPNPASQYSLMEIIGGSLLAAMFFLFHFSYFVIAVFQGDPTFSTAFVVMYLTTTIPTILHLLVTVIFFVSKVFAQPLRAVIEKVLGFIIASPRMTATFLSFALTFVLILLFWILMKLV